MSKKTSKFVQPTWGADPEFFAAYEDAGNMYIMPPVVFRTDHGVETTIEDTDIDQRHPVFKFYDEAKVHEDGAAFEMSVRPSKDWKELWNLINDTKKRFADDVLGKFDICDPCLYSIPTMNWQVERWLNRGKEFDTATRFGCDPDYDAFDMEKACKDIDARLWPYRYAGGHIHVSGIPGIMERPLDAVKSMVITAGLAAMAYSDNPDLDRARTGLYGMPGKFRPQNYPDGTHGVEYRTVSTRWTSSMELAEKVFTWATIGMTAMFQGNLLEKLEGLVLEDAKRAIVQVDQPEALRILSVIESYV